MSQNLSTDVTGNADDYPSLFNVQMHVSGPDGGCWLTIRRRRTLADAREAMRTTTARLPLAQLRLQSVSGALKVNAEY